MTGFLPLAGHRFASGLAGFLWLAVVSCGEETNTEVCDNGFDDDADALVDCGDSDCFGPSCVEQCVDGLDNDGDAFADCADPDCDGGCVEQCTDGRDNDGDALIDCADDQCARILPESCDDGADNDCDGIVDCADSDCDGACAEDCADLRDNDADGALDCEDPDCDGSLACPENCLDGRDNDLDGQVDCLDTECQPSCDEDNDGYEIAEGGGTDCDDSNPNVNPEADEVCNGGIDDDCNGLADDADPDNLLFATGMPVYQDSDYDGYGDLLVGGACSTFPPGNSFLGGDCDDEDPNRKPGATETCGTPDDDCDGLNNDADPSLDLSTAPLWYEDVDDDGYGDPDVSIAACIAPVGFVDNDDDCHLFDPAIGLETEWWPDGDGDGYSAGGVSVFSCVGPIGYGGALGDCDDTNGAQYPGAVGTWPSLLGAWQANGTTEDTTGIQAAGVLVGDVFYEQGVYGQCFQLDGAGDRVEIAMTWEGPLTLSFWMAPGFLPRAAGLVSSADSVVGDDTFAVELLEPDLVELQSNLTDVDIGVAGVEVWMHVAVAYDGADVHTWSDGLPVASAAWIAAEPPEIQQLRLGTDRAELLDFAGRIDDLLLFDRALTDAEVAALSDGSASCLVL